MILGDEAKFFYCDCHQILEGDKDRLYSTVRNCIQKHISGRQKHTSGRQKSASGHQNDVSGRQVLITHVVVSPVQAIA